MRKSWSLFRKIIGTSGFSIPELMLVVAIIGILASASLVFLNPVQAIKRSRDAVRLHGLNTLKSALVLAIQNGMSFGNRCLSVSPCDSLNNALTSDGNGYIDMDLSKDLSSLPRDPLGGSPTFIDVLGQNVPANFQFAHDASGNFEIRAHLEAKDNLSKYTDDGGNSSGYYEVGTKLDIL